MYNTSRKKVVMTVSTHGKRKNIVVSFVLQASALYSISPTILGSEMFYSLYKVTEKKYKT